MYERENAIRNIVSSLILMFAIFFAPVVIENITSFSGNGITAVEIEQKDDTSSPIEDTVIKDLEATSISEIMTPFLKMFKTISRVISIILVLNVILNFLKLAIGMSSVSYSDVVSSVSNEDLSFVKYLNIKKKELLNEETINLAFLNSNKKILENDLDFIRRSIEKKVDWYSFKKDEIKVNEYEKIFNTLLLNVLLDYEDVKEFFIDESNKSENLTMNYDENFKNYIEDEDNYFKIKNKYYLKELVFYVLTNNEIKVSELCNLFISGVERTNLGYTIASFIEEELELNNIYSITDTLEETVNNFNANYNLDLSVGLAKNLIYLSKLNAPRDSYVIDNTNLMSEMKQFKSFLYK